MNATIEKFGYPHSLVREYDHWVVLVRPQQITLASMVLALKSEVTALGQAPEAAFGELKRVTADLEAALAATFAPDKINYLMLMMSDPHVHFHVLPRYASERSIAGMNFVDRAWPVAPSVADVTDTGEAERAAIADTLRGAWAR